VLKKQLSIALTFIIADASQFKRTDNRLLMALDMINRDGRKIVSLGAALLTFLLAFPADAATLEPNRVDVEHVPPKSSAHDPVYKLVQERPILEKIRDLLEHLTKRLNR
jgi:hypothetical protein